MPALCAPPPRCPLVGNCRVNRRVLARQLRFQCSLSLCCGYRCLTREETLRQWAIADITIILRVVSFICARHVPEVRPGQAALQTRPRGCPVSRRSRRNEQAAGSCWGARAIVTRRPMHKHPQFAQGACTSENKRTRGRALSAGGRRETRQSRTLFSLPGVGGKSSSSSFQRSAIVALRRLSKTKRGLT